MTAAFLVASLALAQPAAPLRIVVLAGEDSVNVIQQKSAVAPLVEVRDRNNTPVAGAVVRFAVQGGRSAAFQGGASTLTITTNAAGQAAATGFTPLTAGAVNISVEAAFQGQVVTAAISQVNVLTAAEAAAAASGAGGAGGAGGGGAGAGSGTAAGGGAAGGGGGLSVTTIGIVGGAVAAGAVAGTQLLGQPAVYAGSFSIPATSVFGACSRQESYSGRWEFTLDSDSGSISGSANLRDGRWEITATTCTGGLTVGASTGWGTPAATISGTESSITFETADVVPSGDGNGITISRVFRFQGAMSGDAITGVFDMTWTNSQPNVPAVTLRTNLTLQKQ